MKKILNLILAIVGLVLLAFLVMLEINAIHPFISLPAQHITTINYVVNYGAMAVLGAWIFVYFLGVGPIRILLLILTVIVIALGIVVFGFPQVVTNLLG